MEETKYMIHEIFSYCCVICASLLYVEFCKSRMKVTEEILFLLQEEEERQAQLRERARRLIAEAKQGVVSPSSLHATASSHPPGNSHGMNIDSPIFTFLRLFDVMVINLLIGVNT